MNHLRRIQAAYATAHDLSYDQVGYQPFRAVADWHEAQELQRERETTKAAESAKEDQDGTHDPHPTS